MSESEHNPNNQPAQPNISLAKEPQPHGMPESPQNPIQPTEDANLRQYTMIVYIMYLASILIGITSIVGVIMAYIKRAEFAGSAYESHITYLIRTFWISFIGSVIGALTSFLGIGLLILIAVGIWFIYRSIAGFIKFNDNKPIDAMGWF